MNKSWFKLLQPIDDELLYLFVQEIKIADKQRIEALFERAVHLQLPPKKMKFLFKRYLQYEQEHGDAAAVAHVKKQALEFVQQHVAL